MATDTINSANLTPQATLQVPTYQPTPVDPNIATSAISSVAGQYEAVNKQLEQAQSEQKALAESQMNIQNALLGKTQYAHDASNTAGVNEATRQQNELASQLANLNAQASSLNREAQSIPIANRLQYQQGGIAGTESQVKNANYDQLQQNALKALSIAQQADVASAALTGSQLKLQEAKDKAQQMVDLKYKPLEDMLAMRRDQYEKNKDTLMMYDKKRAEALAALIKKEDREFEEAKANEKGISDLVTNASAQGAPAELRARAAKAKTPMEAANILGVYAGDYLAKEKIRAEIRKMDAEANKARSDANSTSNTGAVSGLVSSNAKAWLDQYNSGALSLEDIYTKIGNTKEAGVLKNQVAQLVAAQGGKRVYGADDATIQAISSQIKNVDDLLKGGVGKIVGVVQGGGGIFLPDSLNVGKQDALAIAKNIVSNQTLQALADAKSKGVTFGALSEGELGLVAESAGRISAKLIKDKDGNITGFSGSESEFIKDLKTVKEGLQKSIATKTQGIQSQEDSIADDILKANKNIGNAMSSTYYIFDK